MHEIIKNNAFIIKNVVLFFEIKRIFIIFAAVKENIFTLNLQIQCSRNLF